MGKNVKRLRAWQLNSAGGLEFKRASSASGWRWDVRASALGPVQFDLHGHNADLETACGELITLLEGIGESVPA